MSEQISDGMGGSLKAITSEAACLNDFSCLNLSPQWVPSIRQETG